MLRPAGFHTVRDAGGAADGGPSAEGRSARAWSADHVFSFGQAPAKPAGTGTARGRVRWRLRLLRIWRRSCPIADGSTNAPGPPRDELRKGSTQIKIQWRRAASPRPTIRLEPAIKATRKMRAIVEEARSGIPTAGATPYTAEADRRRDR